MQTSKFHFLNFLVIALVTFLLAGFQTTFWFQLFGEFPAPLVWLNIILYLMLYRRPTEAILEIYFLGFLISAAYSAQPIGIIWLVFFILFSIVYSVKTRFFWPGPRYFFFASLATTALFHVVFILISQLLEPNPSGLLFLTRMAEIIFTGLISIPTFLVLEKWDRISADELANESATQPNTAEVE
ncbi:MAG: hypothetical protein ACK5P6_03215 [Pseudobdellovibrionaceae bacterium]